MNPCRLNAVFLFAVVFGLHTELLAQAEWRAQTSASSRYSPLLAYDQARSRVVLHGGRRRTAAQTDTWEWDGAAWREIETAPPRGTLVGLTYDAGRSVVVGAGYAAGSSTMRVWEFDGASWSERQAASEPPTLSGTMFAYDPVRQVSVLVGQDSRPPSLRQVWQWDGSVWTQRPDVPPVAFARMVWDVARQRFVVMRLLDVYEWDGGAVWTRFERATPIAAGGGRMAYDPAAQRAVVFGGQAVTGTTWEWTGTSWRERILASTPQPRRWAGVVADSGRSSLLLVGGRAEELFADTWEWDGSAWNLRADDGGPPRHEHGLAFDDRRGRLVLFGGRTGPAATAPALYRDTWEWDGAVWHDVSPSTSPAGRVDPGMAFDAARGRTVLFGGSASTTSTPQPLGDTWEWDGAQWQQRATGGPSARVGHGMTYDSDRERVLVFAGSDGTNALADLWAFDGQGWTLLDAGRSRIAEVALTYDPRAGSVFAFFEESGAVQVWEWDGFWSRTGAVGPATGARRATYHAARGRSVILQGDTTWEFDGVTRTWSSATLTTRPDTFDPRFAYDARGERLIAYGSWVSGPSYGLRWDYASVFPATVERFGVGCSGSAAPIDLAFDGRPWLGDSLELELSDLPAGSTPYLAFGAARAAIDLTSLGIPCVLGTDPLDVLPTQLVGSSAAWSIAVPQDTALIGVHAVFQGLGLATGSGYAGGLALSDALDATIGSR